MSRGGVFGPAAIRKTSTHSAGPPIVSTQFSCVFCILFHREQPLSTAGDTIAGTPGEDRYANPNHLSSEQQEAPTNSPKRCVRSPLSASLPRCIDHAIWRLRAQHLTTFQMIWRPSIRKEFQPLARESRRCNTQNTDAALEKHPNIEIACTARFHQIAK